MQEVLFFKLVVGQLAALFARDARDHWLLPWIAAEVLHLETSTQEVELDHVAGLSVVESDLNAPRSLTCAEEVVFVDSRANNVLNPRNCLQGLALRVRGQARHHQVHDVRLLLLVTVAIVLQT